MEAFKYYPGNIPLIVSVPHCGTFVPPAILDRLSEPAKQLPDTDWHVDKLYDFVREMGAHLLVATHSRYVIDLNRAPDDASLYPGQFTTGLCPTTLFDGSPLYKEGQEPDAAEIEERKAKYWQPYHSKLNEILQSEQQRGRVVLLDAHSIASQMPKLFEGVLPDLNLGTVHATSCAPELAESLEKICTESGYSAVHNGRFRGGYITRHYGKPAAGIHAVQMELTQKNYMQESYPFAYDEIAAKRLQAVLFALVQAMIQYLAGQSG